MPSECPASPLELLQTCMIMGGQLWCLLVSERGGSSILVHSARSALGCVKRGTHPKTAPLFVHADGVVLYVLWCAELSDRLLFVVNDGSRFSVCDVHAYILFVCRRVR